MNNLKVPPIVNWVEPLDLALLVMVLLMAFTDATVLFFHLVFVLLSIGAFFWKFRAFVLRTSFWVTVTTAQVLSAVSSGKIQAEELIEIPLLTIILVTVFMIAGRRAKGQTQIQALNAELEHRVQ